MRKRIFAAFVCLCMLMALVPSMAYANDTVYTGRLCEHHTQHDSACGYSEGAAETPCGHEHTEDCYTLVTKCVHEHTAECYSDGILPADGEEKTADSCSHQCSEESGCITKELNCNHEHDENCGYVPATEGTPCTYVCEICNAQVAEEPECICETKCTEEEPNAGCPVCGGENGDISGCVGAAMMLAPMGAGAITATPPNGEGTEENPYQIKTKEDLYWFAGQVNSGNTGICAKLMDDIVIQTDVLDTNGNLIDDGSGLEEWTPIGNNSAAYAGTFDGMGNDGEVHTISGLYVDSSEVKVGLFGNVNSGTIKNVGVKDSYISGSGTYVGGVCGQSVNSRIENCYNKGTVIGTGGSASVGGVCGQSVNSRIENCYNEGIVIGKGSNAWVGGVCGQNISIIENSYNTGKVNGNIAGGVCGGSNGMIESCYNTGKVSGNTAGGVCGVAMCRIKNCCNKGTVTGTGNVGGVCGQNDSINPIENSYNTGTVNGTNAGGVSGYNNFGTITNCYFLSGTAGNGIGTGSGTVTNVEEKDNRAFSFGEVAWLLNEGQEPKPWGQGTNGSPVLVNHLPAGVTYKMPVRIKIVMPDGITEQYGYTTAGSVLPMSAYPEGYAFYGEQNYQSLINIGEKTYNNDTTIYAKKADETTGITLNPTTLSLYVNDTETLTATVAPVTASQVLKWESSNLSVATVDQNGKVTAVGKGTATITASAHDISSVKATCTVTVKKKSSGGGSVFFWDLKFDTNGGSKIDTVTEWEYSTIDLDEYVPEKEGYKFVGWYDDEDFEKKIDEVYLTQDTTVYAKWEKIEEEVPEEPEEVEETEETETISFLDVKESDWFYEAVSYAVENGLMSGMSEDIFAPNTPLTREMLAVVLYNVEGQPESTEANTFTDVKGDMWYTDAILWANENGIVAGYDNGAYGVGDLITREQFATILYRYAQFKGYDTTQGGMAVREFSDYENISDYARPAMAWAVNAGIMGGMDDGTLMPQGKATRAEAATMLMNFCENVMK